MAKVEVIPNGEVEFTGVKAENGKLAGEPVFYGNGRENASIMTILVKDSKENTVRRYILRVCGADWKVSLQERSTPVVAAAETPKKSKPKSPPQSKESPTPV